MLKKLLLLITVSLPLFSVFGGEISLDNLPIAKQNVSIIVTSENAGISLDSILDSLKLMIGKEIKENDERLTNQELTALANLEIYIKEELNRSPVKKVCVRRMEKRISNTQMQLESTCKISFY